MTNRVKHNDKKRTFKKIMSPNSTPNSAIVICISLFK